MFLTPVVRPSNRDGVHVHYTGRSLGLVDPKERARRSVCAPPGHNGLFAAGQVLDVVRAGIVAAVLHLNRTAHCRYRQERNENCGAEPHADGFHKL